MTTSWPEYGTPDLGTLASLARTALCRELDADALEGIDLLRWRAAEAEARTSEKGDVSGWADVDTCFAIACLDAIMRVTDPSDDEREIERCADSLDALGRHVERIREQVAGEHGPLAGRWDETLRETSETLSSALDLVDSAVATLRETAEREDEHTHYCDDCATNGYDCPVHGAAMRAAHRAVFASPEGVIDALTERGLV